MNISHFKTSRRVEIGKNKILESGVLLGVKPSRKGVSPKLVIGHHPHLRSGTVIYLGSRIGDYLETGHNTLIREENSIGNHFSLWSNSILDYGCRIGSGVKIHCNCYIAQFTTIEDQVFLAPGVVVANDPHPGSPNAIKCMKGPTLKRGAQIGCNVTLLPHVTVGEHSLIGAGSVVTRDIPPYSLAYGNPAKVTKKITDIDCAIDNHKPYGFLQEKYPFEIKK